MFTIPQIRVGDSLNHDRLTVFPLFPVDGTSPGAGYLLSDEALSTGAAVVEEVTEGGSVPHLAVNVTAQTPVLFLEGEELRGAKQNRVLNTSVLVPGKTKTVVPVSCVERGRWRYASKTFGSAGTHASPKLRKILKESAGKSAREGHGHSSDQGAVWDEVDRQMSIMGTASPTAAMADAYESRRDKLDEYRTKLHYPTGAIGMAAVVGGKVASIDLFDAPATCEKVWSRLMTGLAMEAEESTATGDANVDNAMALFATASWSAVPAASAGEEYRCELADGSWHGSALSLDGRLLHGSLVSA